MSSFHLKRDTDETRARVRKGAARTKSERESSRSRATVSPPLSRRRREGERKHFVCLVRRDLSALNKTFEKRFPRALPIIKARQKEEEEKKKKRRRRASLLAWSQSPSA